LTDSLAPPSERRTGVVQILSAQARPEELCDRPSASYLTRASLASAAAEARFGLADRSPRDGCRAGASPAPAPGPRLGAAWAASGVSRLVSSRARTGRASRDRPRSPALLRRAPTVERQFHLRRSTLRRARALWRLVLMSQPPCRTPQLQRPITATISQVLFIGLRRRHCSVGCRRAAISMPRSAVSTCWTASASRSNGARRSARRSRAR